MDSPAPWTLRGHAYVCALAMPDALRRQQGGTAEALGPATGRLGVVMFVDYQRSEVGPYRELLFMPGPCRFPDGLRRWSIGRIYVSSEDSASNGNRNWGLDKRVASFQVERTRYGESVTVRYQDRDIAGLTLKRISNPCPEPYGDRKHHPAVASRQTPHARPLLAWVTAIRRDPWL